jgi:hypothetical protein
MNNLTTYFPGKCMSSKSIPPSACIALNEEMLMILERTAAMTDSFYHCYVGVIIMDQTRMAKKVVENKTEARREALRLKLRWLKSTKNNLRERKFLCWRQRQVVERNKGHVLRVP